MKSSIPSNYQNNLKIPKTCIFRTHIFAIIQTFRVLLKFFLTWRSHPECSGQWLQVQAEAGDEQFNSRVCPAAGTV